MPLVPGDPCPYCLGRQYVKQPHWDKGRIQGQYTEACPHCGGTGKVGKNRKASIWNEWKERQDDSTDKKRT